MADLASLAANPLAKYPRAARLLPLVLFVVLFPLFVVLTFPMDDVARRLEQEVKAQGGELTIETMKTAGLSGLSARGVKLRGPPSVPGGEPGPELRFDRADVRVDVLPLLLRRIGFSYAVEGYGGTASGHASLGKAPQNALDSLTVDARDLDLKALPISDLTGLTAIGRLSAKADVSKLQTADLAAGSITMTMKGAAVTGGQLKVMGGLSVPKAALGDVDAAIALDKGVARVDKLTSRNGDLDTDVDGTVRLKPLLSLSQADLHVRLKLGEAWLNANPVFRGLLSAVNNARQPDGSYVFTLAGPLSNVNARPGR